jgi:hypothetical protein
MTSDELNLLESLGAGVRPFDAVEVDLPSSSVNFDEIYTQAIGGNPRTDLAVVYGPSASGLFSPVDKKHIARGIDLAAVNGVDTALIMHDEHSLRVDVRNRVVLEVVEVHPEQVVQSIDGLVVTQSTGDTHVSSALDESESKLETPARVVRNASLVHALAGRVPK